MADIPIMCIVGLGGEETSWTGRVPFRTSQYVCFDIYGDDLVNLGPLFVKNTGKSLKP